jgi:hypothetical protein
MHFQRTEMAKIPQNHPFLSIREELMDAGDAMNRVGEDRAWGTVVASVKEIPFVKRSFG